MLASWGGFVKDSQQSLSSLSSLRSQLHGQMKNKTLFFQVSRLFWFFVFISFIYIIFSDKKISSMKEIIYDNDLTDLNSQNKREPSNT